jgi:hypothetical protein
VVRAAAGGATTGGGDGEWRRGRARGRGRRNEEERKEKEEEKEGPTVIKGLGAKIRGAKAWRQDITDLGAKPTRHVDPRVATSDASWRQDTWRHDVVAWRHGPWRQAEGPFFEIFPSGAYLRESFKKRAKKQKRRAR